ncbi:hypothetical protein ACRAWD_14345 [Caulobacter segnis]
MLMTDFLLAGSKVETRMFNTPAELTGLKEPVVVNCTGCGARALLEGREHRCPCAARSPG